MAETVTDEHIVHERGFLMDRLPHVSFSKDLLTICCKIYYGASLRGTEVVAGCVDEF
jgi:hypothetical protein